MTGGSTLGLALTWALPASAAGLDEAAPLPPALLLLTIAAALAVLSLAVLAAGALVALRWTRASRQLREEARDARARLLAVNDLLQAGFWQTDAGHRLVGWRPPRGAAPGRWPASMSMSMSMSMSTLASAPASASAEDLPRAGAMAPGPAVPPAPPVWEWFAAPDGSSLRALIERGAPFDDVEVRVGSGAGGALSARVCGRVCTDAGGRFAGYVGSVREAEASPRPASAGTAALVGAASSGTAPAAGAGVLPTGAGMGFSTGAQPTTSVLPPFGVNAAAGAAAEAAPDGDHESFGFTVSHDLRAPIRVVEGFTKIVKEDYGRLLDRVGNDHLDRVLGAAARMNNMIDALLALSRLSSQPLARQPVNLSQLAGFVVDDLRRESPERRVDVEIEGGLQVQGDPTLLRVVLENLIGNAWKYTGKTAEPRIAFARHAEHPATTFTLSDNGAGFDMRFADRLFGVFQRLHSAGDFPGTGIGLASVRRIVRRHGGDIWGEGEVAKGASFHISLPFC